MFKANKIEFLDWVAGFIDAEGCFHIKRKTMSASPEKFVII